MKIAIKLCLFSTLLTFISFNTFGQSCDDGGYQWSDIATIFESSGCSTAGCHGGGSGGLDLTTYAGFSAGGTKCGTEIFNGTTLVDIIEMGATCGDTGGGAGGTLAAMNNFLPAPVSSADIAAIQAYMDAGAFENCRGVAEVDGLCDPASTVGALTDPGQTSLCTDGSDAPLFTAPSSSLPDVQVAIEINGTLVDISDDGSFDYTIMTDGDEICYTAFGFDLVAINQLLLDANTLCNILDCDGIFEIPGLEAAIMELIDGNNTGSVGPGLDDLNEALAFASSFGTPVESVQSAVSVLSSLNDAIGAFSLGPVCFATSDNVCLSVAECAPPEPGIATTDGLCDPASQVDPISLDGQSSLCSDGSDAPTFTSSSTSLPDVQMAVEINGALVDITDDGAFDTSSLVEGDEVCYTAFAFDLAAINSLLMDADGLCAILDCDMIFEIPGLEAAIVELISGDNDGVPGLNDLNEALTFAGSFGTPIESVLGATTTLTSLNEAIGAFSLGPVCFATSDFVCLSVAECAPPEPGIATTDGLCDPASQVDPISLDGQSSLCPGGSDLPTFTPSSTSLPDVQMAVEINGALVDITDDGAFDTSSLVEGDEVCYTAFAFDLAAINSLLMDADGLCAILDCDMIFEIPGLEAAIVELINGDNDGVPGLNNLNEALTFAGSFGTPIESVLGATTTLTSLNEAIGAFSLGPVCFATSDFVCLPVAVSPEPAEGCDDGDCSNGIESWNGCECVVSAGGDLGCTNPDACNYDVAATCDDGSCQLPPAEPSGLECYETANFDAAACDWTISGDLPPAPLTACYETATFDDTVCDYVITGEQPTQPITACYEIASFDGGSCMWILDGYPPVMPPTACYETATFNDATCGWDVTGVQPTQPTTACYETATFNDGTCAWEVTGEQPTQPTDLACYESVGAFDDTTCTWQVIGEQPPIDDACDLTTDTFDDATCMAVNTPNCPDNTSFNSVDCLCEDDVILGCTDICASNYEPMANADDGSCILPEEPATACYQTSTFNNTTCMWDVTGVQPDSPATACYETATFNDGTCSWDVTGVQPDQPTGLACYQSVDSFDDATCAWIVIGEQPPVDDGCDLTTDTFDEVTCIAVNTPDCPAGTSFDSANCACTSDPVPGCMDDAACNYDPNATVDDGSCTFLPAEPTDLECYETATANSTTCSWDITGEQPPIDDGCDVTIDTFDDATCMAVNTPDCAAGTTYDAVNCACTTDIMCEDPCAPNFGDAEACDSYDMTCPEDTCIEFYSWNAESCTCDVAVVDLPDCDDGNECTADDYDFTLCECTNTPIPDCGACVSPTPGTIDCE